MTKETRQEAIVHGHKWPKNTLLRVKSELVGGSLLEPLQPPDEQTHKVRVSSGAFEALKGLRIDGERIQDVMERLIFAAAAGSPTSLQSYPGAGGT